MITVQYKDFDDMVNMARYITELVSGQSDKGNTALPETLPVTEAPEHIDEAPFVTDAEVSSTKQDTKKEEAAAAPPVAEKTYALEDVRAKLAELNKSGKRAEVKSLLGSFGAVKLSDVPADKYGELMEKAGEI